MAFKKVRSGFKIGVDLGTANTLVYIDGQGVIFNEPSIVAFDRQSGDRIAAGTKAYAMLGKEHHLIKVVRPMEGGVISDISGTSALLTFVFERLENIDIDFAKSTLLICCPSEITSIERVAMRDLAHKVGIKDVFVEEEVKAGAIGAGIDIYSPEGSMVIDIGGGSTDIGVLSLGDLVVSESIRTAGNYLDSEIIKHVKFSHHLLIGPKTAERVKIHLGTVEEVLSGDKTLTIAGRDLKTGLPRRIDITQEEVKHIFVKAFEQMLTVSKKVLSMAPPELSGDIFRKGIVINGGGALIGGVEEYFQKHLNLSVKIADAPLTSIVQGTKILLKNRGNYLVRPVD